MTKWHNNGFGKSGRFYPLLYLVPIPIALSALIIGGSLLSGDHALWERVIILVFSISFLFYFWKGVEAVMISRRVIMEAILRDGALAVTTFGGETIAVNKTADISLDSEFFKKKNIRFMFPRGYVHAVVYRGGRSYYVAGNMRDAKSLFELLTKIAHEG